MVWLDLYPVDRERCQRDNHVAQGEWMGDNKSSEVEENAPLQNPLHTRVRQSGTARHLHLDLRGWQHPVQDVAVCTCCKLLPPARRACRAVCPVAG